MNNRNNDEVDFIAISKQCLLDYLNKNLASHQDANMKEFLTAFNSAKNSNDYKKIETNCFELFKIALEKAKRSIDGQNAIGPFYYILGTCQLAQGKNSEAQISFFAFHMLITQMIKEETPPKADLVVPDTIGMLAQAFICLTDLNTKNIYMAGRWCLEGAILDEIFKRKNIFDPLHKKELHNLWLSYLKKAEEVLVDANKMHTQTDRDETLAIHNSLVLWNNITIKENKTAADHQNLINYQEHLISSEWFHKLPLELPPEYNQSFLPEDIQNFLIVSYMHLLIEDFNRKVNKQPVLKRNLEQMIKIIIKSQEYLPIYSFIRKIVVEIKQIKIKQNRLHLLREFKEILKAAFVQLKINDAIFCYPVDDHYNDIDSLIKGERFADINIKSEFIKDSKETIKDSLEKIMIDFSDDMDADTIKSINEFLKNHDNYQTVKINCIITLKNLAKKNIYRSNHWDELLAGLNIIIGICHMMEDQYVNAQMCFDEVLLLTKNDDLYAMAIFLNKFSVYTRLRKDQDGDKRIRAIYRYHIDTKLLAIRTNKKYHFSNNLFTKFETMFSEVFVTSSNINVKEGSDLRKDFKAWESDKTNKNIHKKILDSKYLCVMNESDKMEFFTFIILDQLKEGLSLINMKKALPENHYRLIANHVKEASKYCSISFFIKELLKQIESNASDRYAQTLEFKKVLELLKEDRFGFCSKYEDQEIASLISRCAPKNLIKPIEISLARDKFLASSQVIAKSVLLSLYAAVRPQYREECQKLIDQFLMIKHPSAAFNDYIKLYNKCELVIYKLNIKMKSGPELDIANYIKSVSIIGKSNNTDLNESALNEILMRPSTIEIKNLSLFTRTYFRLLNEEWLSLGDDLNKINALPDKEKIVAMKEFLEIKESINQHLEAYRRENPVTYSAPLEDMNNLLENFTSQIAENKFKEALSLQLEIEAAFHRNKQAHADKWMTFNFWSTILFLKLRSQSIDNQTKLGDRSLIHLKNTLNGDTDILVQFYKVISSLRNSHFLKLFLQDYKIIAKDQFTNLTFEHLLQKILANKEAKALIDEYNDEKIRYQEDKMNNKPIKETSGKTTQKNNTQKRVPEEKQILHPKKPVVTNQPLTKNKILEIERKKKEYMLQVAQENEQIQRNMDAEKNKFTVVPIPDKENDDRKAKVEKLKRKLGYEYLSSFFNDDFSLLKNLNSLAFWHGSPLMFKGSFVAKWYLNMVHHIEELRSQEYENSINPSSLITINDIDAFIECKDEFHLLLLANQLQEWFGFCDRIEGVDKEGSPYINIRKDLGNGYIFDLTLQLKKEIKKLDFNYISHGLACFTLCDDIDINTPVTLSFNNKTETLNDRNKAFHDVCSAGKLKFGVPDSNMTSCAYRLYKCLLKYAKMELDKEGLKRAKEELKKIYVNSLKNNGNAYQVESVYLELFDFIKHDDVCLPNEVATPIIQLAFEALFEHNKIIYSDVKKFIKDYFRKENFNARSKYEFKNEIDTLILRYQYEQKQKVEPTTNYRHGKNPNITFSPPINKVREPVNNARQTTQKMKQKKY